MNLNPDDTGLRIEVSQEIRNISCPITSHLSVFETASLPRDADGVEGVVANQRQAGQVMLPALGG